MKYFMPRKARIDAPGALHHIIVRGIEKRTIFNDDLDRNNFLDRLGRVLSETDTQCFAWALIPNHFHLLLRTGSYPISTVMRRLLTGHAINFNRRHGRSGYLFQNRYKSILCQEDTYLLELVRYLHLNPIRAGQVADIEALDTYPFCGHAVIMGKAERAWQDDTTVLQLFDKRRSAARRRYKIFVQRGILKGRRPEFSGGGLIRSNGGWSMITSLRRKNRHLKGDERVLGDSDFVERVLKAADESLERKYRLKSMGFDVKKLADTVASIFAIKPEEIFHPGKQPIKVKARSLFCYWAVRELGITMAQLAQKLSISQPAVSLSVRRGERIASENGYLLMDEYKLIN
jgi:REP element-mobilizing transposase RayT